MAHHLRQAFRKLSIASRVELTRIVIEQRIVFQLQRFLQLLWLVGNGRLRFNLESALGIGKVMDDAVRDRLVSTFDDVRFPGRGEGRPMSC